MNKPGWTEIRDRIYQRVYQRPHGSETAIVAQFDGWNWGWIGLDGSGLVLAGEIGPHLTREDAMEAAAAELLHDTEIPAPMQAH